MMGVSHIFTICLLGSTANAFFEQMFGGNAQFQEPPEFRWPKGIPKKIHPSFDYMKGTEWKWNKWRNVKFNHDGTFTAPTPDCEEDMCKWSATKDSVYIVWGDAGVHILAPKGEREAKEGSSIEGIRKKDKQKCTAEFIRIDEEAAELHKDLFAELGLADGATDGEIKKAYRKMSVIYHPDKNKDDPAALKKFNSIRSAYEVLSDGDKRFLYETAGLAAVREAEKEDASGGQGGGMQAMFGGGRPKKQRQAKKGNDYKTDYKLSLETLYNGESVSTTIKRRVVCKRCADKPDAPHCKGCKACPGDVKMVQKRMGNMIVQQQVNVPSSQRCKDESAVLETLVERGMADQSELKFPRMSEQKPGEIPGDVLLKLKTIKHAVFTRKKNDLHAVHHISLKEALTGFKSSITHMDKRIVEFGRDGVSEPEMRLKIKGEGMPLHDDPSEFGDLILTLRIEFPKTISEENQAKIKAIF